MALAVVAAEVRSDVCGTRTDGMARQSNTPPITHGASGLSAFGGPPSWNGDPTRGLVAGTGGDEIARVGGIE
jgi:hypothetical protein